MRDLRVHPTVSGGAIGVRKFFSACTRLVTHDFKLGVELTERVDDAIELALANRS